MPDGSIIVAEVVPEKLSRAQPNGRVEVIAAIPGAPIGAPRGRHGEMYVCGSRGFARIEQGRTLWPALKSPTVPVEALKSSTSPPAGGRGSSRDADRLENGNNACT